ncbi:MAG TPA: putative toxin-antitoxin system toxin component, PIN family [Caulobacterales bacterium]|nr:putative toxin-antitoxin system toxin component, PIN family [Caulobacterales bacterium]
MRVVLDTNVIIAGLRSRTGASAELLRRVLGGELEAAATTALLLEYEAVATRPGLRQASGFSASEVLEVIDALGAVMVPVPVRWRLRPQSSDPDDDFVIEAAFNARADVLVTANRRDLEAACAVLGIRTLSAHMVLKELRSAE